MKKSKSKALSRVLNHYSTWKYVVLVVTVVVLALSAIPTWYGEQPSIQIQSSDPSGQLANVVSVNRHLKQQGVDAQEITQQKNQIVLVFGNETDQTHAREALDKLVKEGTALPILTCRWRPNGTANWVLAQSSWVWTCEVVFSSCLTWMSTKHFRNSATPW